LDLAFTGEHFLADDSRADEPFGVLWLGVAPQKLERACIGARAGASLPSARADTT
jgi:hypothetical protein